MTIRGFHFSDELIDAISKRSISMSIGWEIVSETKNGSVHYLGKRTLRKSVASEFGVWYIDPTTKKRKLVYVMVKISEYANGVMLHLYHEMLNADPATEWALGETKSQISALISEFGKKIEPRQPGEPRKNLEGVSFKW
jgi:hypothetical protein